MLDALAEQEERIAVRLRKLRADVGHPTRPGQPLPADLAAEQAGVKYRQWQRWEQGRTMPRSASLEQVAEAFGVDVAEFYETEDGQPLSQLDRIEAKLDRLLVLQGEEPVTPAEEADQVTEEIEDELAQRAADGQPGTGPRRSAAGARARSRRAGGARRAR